MLNNLKGDLNRRRILKEDNDNFRKSLDPLSLFMEDDETVSELIQTDGESDATNTRPKEGSNVGEEIDAHAGAKDYEESLELPDDEKVKDTTDKKAIEALDKAEELEEGKALLNRLMEEMAEADVTPDNDLTKEKLHDDDSVLNDPSDMEPATSLDKEELHDDDYSVDTKSDNDPDSLLDKEEQYEEEIEEVEDVITLDESYAFILEDVIDEMKEKDQEESEIVEEIIDGSESMTGDKVDDEIDEVIEDEEDEIIEDDEEEKDKSIEEALDFFMREEMEDTTDDVLEDGEEEKDEIKEEIIDGKEEIEELADEVDEEQEEIEELTESLLNMI